MLEELRNNFVADPKQLSHLGFKLHVRSRRECDAPLLVNKQLSKYFDLLRRDLPFKLGGEHEVVRCPRSCSGFEGLELQIPKQLHRRVKYVTWNTVTCEDAFQDAGAQRWLNTNGPWHADEQHSSLLSGTEVFLQDAPAPPTRLEL